MMEDINNGKYNFKNKNILIFLIGIFLVLNLSFVSAATFDNIKNFDKDIGNYGKVEIRNSVLGFEWWQLDTVAELEVKENTDTCILNRCRSKIEITMYEKGKLVDDVNFVGGGINSYQFYLNGNPYNNEEVEIGTYTLELIGTIRQTTDWQITSQGILIEEWLLWTADDGLVSFYALNETTGATASDSTGTNAGTAIDMENGDWEPGLLNNSLKFDGTNEYVDLGTMGTYGSTMSEGFAISFWFNSTDGSVMQMPLGGGNATTTVNLMLNGQRTQAFTSGTIGIYIRDNDGTTLGANAVTGTNLSNGNWTHIVLMANGSGFLELYLNGENQTLTDPLTGSPNNMGNFDDDFYLGAGNDAGSSVFEFKGSLDEVGFWNTTLSASEISSLYNYGNGLSYGGVEDTLLTLTINSPVNDSKVYAQENITINSSSSTLTTLTNTTLSLDGVLNETIMLNGTSNETVFEKDISSFSLGNHNFNIELCDLTSCVNTTTYFDLQPFKINNETYNSTTYETSNENFFLNLTSNNSYSITANLIYEGTSYTGTKTGDNSEMTFSRSLDIPSNGTKEFYWTITSGTLFNSSIQNQTAAEINLSLCGGAGGSVPYINFTFKDEETLATINATSDLATWNYWLGDGTVSKSYLFTNTTENPSYPFCFNPADETLNNDLTFQYAGEGGENFNYPQRVHFRDSDLTNSTTNQVLYLLSSTDGIYSSIQVQDINLNAIEGITVTIERQFSGVWVQVSRGTTDASGIFTSWVNPDYSHRITVFGLGYTSVQRTIQPTQSTYTIILGEAVESTEYAFEGISYSTYPPPGILNPNTNYTFGFNVTASKGNLVDCKLELRNKTFGLLTSVTGCGVSGGNISVSFNTSTIQKIFGSYYVDLGGGYQLLKSNDAWMVEAINLTGNGAVFFQAMQDFVNWEEFGDTHNRREFSRITFFFIALTIALGAFSFFTGFEGTNPGGILLILWGIIGIFSIGGLFTIEGITRNDFMAKYSLFLCASFLTWGFLINHWRRNTA